MRLLSSIVLSFLLLLNTGTGYAQADKQPINGAWVPVQEEIAGQVLPQAALAGQKLVVQDSAYTFFAESADKGIVRYSDGKMDIYGKDGVNAGKHFMAIYKYANGQLTICYNLAGDGYPASFETKSKPTLFMCVFKPAQ